jgi:iron complex outermembrane receptor protein
MHGLKIVRYLAAAAVLLPVLARAQAPAPAPPARADTAVYADPGVEVKAPRVRATSGGTSAVGVGLDTARAGPDPTLERVLRQMPLIVVRANSRGEAQPALRGSEDRQIAILVDGVPITLGWDDRADLSVVPLAGARSVTLYRGLPSVLLGPNVLGGAVEVDVARGRRRDTKPRPLTIEAGMDQTGAGSATLAGGMLRETAGTQWVGRAGAGYRGQDGAALASGLGSGDPSTVAKLTSDGDLRLNNDVATMNGFFSLRRLREGGGWASLSASGYRLERGVPPESHVSEPRLWRYPLQSRVVTALSAGSGFFTTPWGQGDVEASVGLDLGRTEIDAYDSLDYRNVVETEDNDDRTVTLRLLGDHTLGARGTLRTALTGADIRHDEVLSTGGPSSYRQRLWSLAGETEWRFAEGGGGTPLRVSVGGAADGSDTPVTADKPAARASHRCASSIPERSGASCPIRRWGRRC